MATKRIAVLGGPRCGKTTLIQHLYVEMKIAGLNAGYALEYSTEYLKDKGMIETISEQYGIYLGQKKLEDELSAFDYALTDYATFVPYIYGRFMLGDKENLHYVVGLTGKEYSVILDLDDFNKLKDLTRLKLGLTLEGIRLLRDNSGKFQKAIDKFNKNNFNKLYIIYF